MEFTKEQTNVAKGVAICLMFIHHLYAFNNRLQNGNSYIPMIPYFQIGFKVAWFGNICVAMFLFLSGYGMYLGYTKSTKKVLHYSLLKLKDFYLTYWLYFLAFVPIGIFYFQEVTIEKTNIVRYSSEPIVFFTNFIGWSSTYNEEWWFVKTFIICVIFLFPIYSTLVNKNFTIVALISLFLLTFSSAVDRYNSPLGFIYWQTSFALGIICAQLKFFSSDLIKAFDKLERIWIFAWLILCIILRIQLGSTKYDFLLVPFFIYFSCKAVAILNLSQLFAYLGKYSFPLWLIHSFFCYYYFQSIVYLPKWSPLVFINLTVISLISVLGIERLCFYFLQLKKNLVISNIDDSNR